MPKETATLKQTQQRLSAHKFDTSNYIVMDTGVRRDINTGRLISEKTPQTGTSKPK